MEDRLTDDDELRWIVVGGRRWRRSDPSIPEPLRQELVGELMDARRRVDRPRVQDAKVALGERGRAWWEPADEGEVVVTQKGEPVDGRTAKGPVRIAPVVGVRSNVPH